MSQQLYTETSLSTPLTSVVMETPSYRSVIDEVCGLNWSGLSRDELIDVAWMYYYFSVQFCETVGIARDLFPDDKQLESLDAGERNTDNLSPCAGVVGVGERVDHDEFMRRTLTLTPIDPARRLRLQAIGAAYLTKIRAASAILRSRSLASYEDGGLERVFRSILNARDWNDPLLVAFKHFLIGHIELDSDPAGGHGALCRHLQPTEDVVDVWLAFRDGLTAAAPTLLEPVCDGVEKAPALQA
ncbi:MAG: hypothetical protein CTY15_09140 [Methylocystis sp.]|nr:MAG: hypothetical protein CTY15_09140 [Methylocystis sp.]